ncbi:24258_t:CDS:1, partial [Racocetra persica]
PNFKSVKPQSSGYAPSQDFVCWDYVPSGFCMAPDRQNLEMSERQHLETLKF